MEQKLKSVPYILKQTFVDTDYEDLRRLYFTLLEIPELREYMDRIFKQQLQMEDVRMPQRLVRQFAEFIRGITYFSTEGGDGLLLYHRLMKPECYLDHLIYDHMKRHSMKPNEAPDDPYREWIEQTRDAHRDTDIKIDIDYDDGWPIELIVWCGGYKEMYRKRLVKDAFCGYYYEPVVEICREHLETGEVCCKMQTDTRPKPWEE